MKVGVIGLGHVGLTLAIAFAHYDYKVVGIDIDLEKIERIKRGELPFYDEELSKRLKEVINKKLFVYSNYKFLEDIDIVFICIDTPTLPSGKQNINNIFSAIKSLASIWKKTKNFKIIIIKSTVLPGTTRRLSDLFSNLTGLMPGVNFGFVINPEFLREGTGLRDILYPDRVVIGCLENYSCKLVRKLWEDFYSKVGTIPPILILNSEEAELVKLASNAFLAMRISYANTIASICEHLPNCDAVKVLRAVGLDKRIGKTYLNPGLGYGGSCLPKDVKALIFFMKKLKVDPALFKAVDKVNERQYIKIIRFLLQEYGSLKDKIITVLGVSFKPNTDDIKNSISIKVIDLLIRLRAKVKVHDPIALDKIKDIYGDTIIYEQNIISAIKDADALIIITEWDSYLELKPSDFKKYMRNPVIIDGRRIYDSRLLLTEGVKYYAIGYNSFLY